MTTFSIDEEFIDLFPENWRIDISQDGTGVNGINGFERRRHSKSRLRVRIS